MAEAANIIANLSLNNENFKEELKKSTQILDNFGSSMVNLGSKIAIAGAAVSAPFYMAIRAASNLEETMQKFNVVFGKNSTAVSAWASNLSNSLGRSSQQMHAFMGNTQDLFVPLGFAEKEAIGLSKSVTQLAIDLASFSNSSDEASLTDLHAALTGSGEVMKKYGVIVNEATVASELLSRSIDPKSATEQEKVQARLNIIMKGTTTAHGDAARSAGSFANQEKRAGGAMNDLLAVIGGQLLPVVTPIVTLIADVCKWMTEFAKENKSLVIVVAGLGAGLVVLGATMLAVGGLSKILAFSFTMMASKMTALMATQIGWNSLLVITKGLMTALIAHPLVGSLVVLAAVGVGVASMFDKQSAALKKATQERSQATASIHESNEALKQSQEEEQRKMARLTELGKAEKLSATQQLEAMMLINQLNDKYKTLGLSIDKVTGKIIGLANAQTVLNETQKSEKTKGIEDEFKALQKEVTANMAELKNKSGRWNAVFSPIESYSGKLKSDIDDLGKTIKEKHDQMDELLEELEKSKETDNTRELMQSKTANPEDAKKALKEISDFEKKLATEKLSAYEQEQKKIKENFEMQRKNINLLRDDAKAKSELFKFEASKTDDKAKGDEFLIKASQQDDIVNNLNAQEKSLNDNESTILSKKEKEHFKAVTAEQKKIEDELAEQRKDDADYITNGNERYMTALEREIAAINQDADNRLEMLKKRKRTLQERIEERNDKMGSVDSIEAVSMRKQNVLDNDAIASTEEEADNVKDARDNAVDDAKLKSQKSIEEYIQKNKKAQDDLIRKRENNKEEEDFKKRLESDPETAVDSLKILQENAKNFAVSALAEYKKELEIAKKDGQITDDEQKKLDEKQESYMQSEGKQDDIAKRLEEAYKAIKKSASARSEGSFSSAALKNMGTQNDPSVKTARNTEDIAKTVRTIVNKLANLKFDGIKFA